MSIIVPTPPTAAPAVPDRSIRSTFSGLMYTMFQWCHDHLVTDMYALASNAWNNATDAFNSAAAALANANLAIAAGGATLWVSGTTYSVVGTVVISPATLRTYRRKIAGGGTTDPSADTTNWTPTSTGPLWVTRTGTYTAVAGDAIRANTSGGTLVVTLPASPVDNDFIDFMDYAGTFSTNKLQFLRNGKNIMGLAEDLDITVSNFNDRLIFTAATNDWRLQ